MGYDIIETNIKLINEGIKMEATSRENPAITLDYFPPYGHAEGYTPLELVLISFAACTGTTVLTMLRGRQKRTITGLTAESKGYQRDRHPKTFDKIELHLTLTSPDLLDEELKEALAVAEEKLCPVWALLKGNVETDVTFEIKRG